MADGPLTLTLPPNGGEGNGWRFQERAGSLERAEQNLHAMTQFGVCGAGFVQIRGTLVGGQLEGGLEDRFLTLVRLVHEMDESSFSQCEIVRRILSGEKRY